MNDIVPMSSKEMFDIAEKIAQSPLIPDAYRGKPTEAAIAMMYGAEVGLPPMTSLQRIVVINGKPTLDAQAMTALIRSAGHSLTGDATATEATATGKRQDTGDVMSVTFTIEDARLAGLVRQNGPWTKFPKSMLWARAVSQLARELFGDVLLGMSYVPEEMQAVEDDKPKSYVRQAYETNPVVEMVEVDVLPPPPTLRPPPTAVPAMVADESTGEVLDSLRAAAEADEQLPKVSELDEKKQVLNDIVRSTQPMGEQAKLKAHLLGRYGASANITDPAIMQECIDIAIGWPQTDPRGAPAVQPQEIPF